jgi:hypothetical protein
MHVDSSILSLLVCGHVLADFLFRTEAAARAQRTSARAWFAHALVVAVVQAAVVLPFAWNAAGAALVGGIAVVHALVDRARSGAERRWPRRPLAWLLSEQALHFAVLAAAASPWPARVDPAWMEELARGALVLAVVVFNAAGGSAIVVASLADLGIEDLNSEGPPGAGRRIGVLERWIILGLVWLGQWGTVGLVLTAKSVARFKKMDEQAFAEIYLIGTMTSVIVAMVSGAVLRTAA